MISTVRIELTNYCNRDCSYCFFREKLADRTSEMSFADYQYIVERCEKEKVERVHLQGGEPTSYSHFPEALDLLRKKHIFYKLLTNGVFETELLDRLDVSKRNDVLINYNHPDTYNATGDWDLVNRNIAGLERMGMQFQLGYTIYERKPDYDFFLQAIKKYKISEVRWDLARPSGEFTNKYFNLNDFFEMMPVVSDFVEACHKLKPYIFPFADCPIPVCVWFHGGEYPMSSMDYFKHFLCSSCINIGPGLVIGTCPGSVQFRNIKLTDFQSITQAARFVEKEVNDHVNSIWLLEDCKNCIHRILNECHGGCPGLKRLKENKIVGREELSRFLAADNSVSPVRKIPDLLSGPISPEKETDIDSAVELYKGQLKKNSCSVYALFSLGRCYEAKSQYENAIQIYEKLAVRSEMRKIITNRMDLIYQLRAVKNNPGNRMAWMRLRDIFFKIGYEEEANYTQEEFVSNAAGRHV